VLQPLVGQFPTQINRENILKNREFETKNRELARPDAAMLRCLEDCAGLLVGRSLSGWLDQACSAVFMR
jgi:hypothetical protein